MGTGSFTDEIAGRIEGIRHDRLHGATFLAGEAVRTLVLAAEALAPGEESIPTLKDVGRRLALTRPAMAAVKNMVARFTGGMGNQAEVWDPRALGCELLARMEADSKEAADKAAEIIHQGPGCLPAATAQPCCAASRPHWLRERDLAYWR